MSTANHEYSELVLAYETLQTQNELYRPTVFWDEASSRIVAELEANGVESFRSLDTTLGFFVPTYGLPGGGFGAEQGWGLRDWVKGEYPEDAKPQFDLNHLLNGHIQH